MRKPLSYANQVVDSKPPERPDNTMTEVYDRHVDTVYRVCYSLMGNKQDAEDATQSVFVKLLESGKCFADAEHEKAWLIVTARNKCRDLHRKWWRRKVIDLDMDSLGRSGSDPVSHSDLEDKLRKLCWTNRLVLYLYYYEGYKLAEIAALLKLNLNTVKTRMRTAKKRLKLEMGDDFRE